MDRPASTLNTINSVTFQSSDLQPHLQPTDYQESQDELIQLFNSHRDTIALPNEPLGRTDVVQNKIQLIDTSKPVYIPAYRLPHSKRALVERTVSDMLKEGIIEHSVSPMFLLPKRSGEWRTFVDFGQLNKLTVSLRYPMPVLDEILNSLGDKNTSVLYIRFVFSFLAIPASQR